MEAAQAIETPPEPEGDEADDWRQHEKPGDRISLDGLEVDPTLGCKVHPFADAFPMMEGADFEELVEDIRRNGLQECIECIDHKGDDILIDGRNRLRACLAADVEPQWTSVLVYNDEEVLAHIRSKNVHRRHHTASQRAMVATELQSFVEQLRQANESAKQVGLRRGAEQSAIYAERNAEREAERARFRAAHPSREGNVAPTGTTAAAVAKIAGTSERTAKDALRVRESGDEELIGKVKSGEMPVSKAAKEVRVAEQGPAPAKNARTVAVADAVVVGGKSSSPGTTAVLADFIDFILKCRKELKSNFTPELSEHAERLEKNLRSLLQQAQP